MKTIHTDSNANDFAKYYEQSLPAKGYYKPGQAVETEVVSISNDCVFLQLGGKSEGILDRDELTDKDGNLSVKEGDKLRVFFQKAENGELHFTAKIRGEAAGTEMIQQAYLDKTPVEGLVEKEIKGGYEVKLGELRAFCPYSKMGERRSDNPAEFIGKRLPFKIQEFKDGGRSILVSNRVIHEEARLEKLEELKKTLHEGMVVSGTIMSIQSFGAFVDIGGIQALLPVSEMSRSRVEDISALVSVGQEIQASILKLDWQAERFTLSLKSLLGDPWDGVTEKYLVGTKHTGKVVRLADFGAFVALEPGIDGLVHSSEINKANSYGAGQNLDPKVGQSLSVEILGVDRAHKRISLKPATTAEEDATAAKYLGDSDDSETYNPFAALLKKK